MEHVKCMRDVWGGAGRGKKCLQGPIVLAIPPIIKSANLSCL